MIMLPFVLSGFSVIPTLSTLIESANLTTSNTNIDGASISVTHSDCSVFNNEWLITVENANNTHVYEGFHLEIDLNNSWGFHPTKTSTISLTMHGTTIIDVNDSDTLFVFSVNNEKYITVLLAFDDAFQNVIYPSTASGALCESYDTINPSVSLGTGDIKTCVLQTTCNGETERAYKASGGNAFGGMMPYRNPPQNAWPMTISLTNDPMHNEVRIRLDTPSWDSWFQGCAYGDSFATDVGLQVYIALDENSEAIAYTGFDMRYEYDTDGETTTLPTNNPSQQSTQMHTVTPTKNPITIPSINPTKFQTSDPTDITTPNSRGNTIDPVTILVEVVYATNMSNIYTEVPTKAMVYKDTNTLFVESFHWLYVAISLCTSIVVCVVVILPVYCICFKGRKIEIRVTVTERPPGSSFMEITRPPRIIKLPSDSTSVQIAQRSQHVNYFDVYDDFGAVKETEELQMEDLDRLVSKNATYGSSTCTQGLISYDTTSYNVCVKCMDCGVIIEGTLHECDELFYCSDCWVINEHDDKEYSDMYHNSNLSLIMDDVTAGGTKQ